MRNNQWLIERLNYFLEKYFFDVKIKNKIKIFFGRKAKTRLGSIKYDKITGETNIRITGYFRNKNKIPQYVVDATILHELVHYVHGFSSPLQQNFRQPHQGGIVRRELKKRDLEEYEIRSKKWLKNNCQRMMYGKKRVRIRKVCLPRFRFLDLFNF